MVVDNALFAASDTKETSGKVILPKGIWLSGDGITGEGLASLT